MIVAPEARGSLVKLLRSMMLIRAFEESLMRLPRPGFQLLSSGQEGVAAGVCAGMAPADQLLCSGRSLGPALARGLDPRAVMAEVLGKASGPCKGKGGRGHLAQPDLGFFGAHAVVGGNLAVAAGVALAAQLRQTSAVVVCLFGDGACGAGVLHETLNLAALWQLPLLLVCDNNQYAISTPVRQALAPTRLSALAQPFGLPGQTVDGMDVLQVRDKVAEFVDRARAGQGAALLECVSYRFAAHSSSARETRDAEEIRDWTTRCPIRMLADRLVAEALLSPADLIHLRHEVAEEVAAAVRFAEAAPDVAVSEVLEDVG
jgi:TPP-dependent pyruvate/acetoin dehydrogenase alpha subunit